MEEKQDLQALPLTPEASPAAEAETEKEPVCQKRRLFTWLDQKGSGALPLVLAFLLPFLIFSVCLILEQLYPFGDRQILNYDGWHQYYPFLLKLWDHFDSGASLLYDWSMGMGTNFLSMLSYYGASPFNLVLIFVRAREFRVLFALLVAIRIGLSGLFAALFLKKTTKKAGWSVAFFALGYALCGYLMGYYWNVMWLDSVALFPLICLGLVKLFREGKCWLYVLSLALSLFSNYYISFMSCVFVVVAFFLLCIVDRVRLSDFVRKGFRLLLTTVLAAGMCAVLLLPALFGLLNTASTQDATGMYSAFYESIRDLLAPLSSFHYPAVMEGLPNLNTAAILVLFAFAFLWAKKIGLREKLCAFFLVVFLLLSMNYSVLNYIWHGFHYTNMIPYRFAYVFAFVVLVMAYDYYQKALDGFDWIDGVGMLVFAVLVAFCALGYYPTWSILATVAVFSVTVILTSLRSVGVVGKRLFSLLVCLILVVETSVSAYMGTKVVGTTPYSDYLDPEVSVTYEQIGQLLDVVEEKEGDSKDFYRMEMTEWYTLNDSCLYDYNGISQFSSSANRGVSSFLLGLGMPADPGSNRFVYVHGTPLGNALLGVKYLINRSGYLSDTGLECLRAADNENLAALYEETAFSGLGFMTERDAAAFYFDMDIAPYERQNQLFRSLTGLEGDLFIPLEAQEGLHTGMEVTRYEGDIFTMEPLAESESEGSPVLRLSYTMPHDGMVYVYADVPMANSVQINNARHSIEDYANFFSAGYFRSGSSFHLLTEIYGDDTKENYASYDVVVMDGELWEKGLALLQDEKMEITSWEDTHFEATVTALKDGYLYTSIPMEPGDSWTVTVDGERVETTPFANAFVGLYLSAGEHRLEFTYSPLGFDKGLWISVVSILLFAALCVMEKKGKKLFPEKPLPTPPERGESASEEAEKQEGNEEEIKEEHETTKADVDHPQGD